MIWMCPKGFRQVQGAPYCVARTTFLKPGAKWTLAAVLRTWKMDCAVGMQALRSLVAVIPMDQYNLTILVITDELSRSNVSTQLDRARAQGFFSKHGVDVPVKFFVEPKLLENGHIQQKYSKLTADTHTSAQYILHVDSDLWYHSWNEDCFFSPTDHRPIVEFDSWDHLTPEVEQWRNGSERLLKLPVGAIKFEYSRANQHVYPRSLYRGLRSYLETRHGKSFEKIFKETPLVGTNAHLVAKRAHGVSSALLVSDFNLIGAFAHYFAPRSVHFVNLGSPSKDDPPHAECVSQCNLRLFSPKCCLAWFNAIEGFEAKEDASRLHEFSQTFFANSDQCNSNNLH